MFKPEDFLSHIYDNVALFCGIILDYCIIYFFKIVDYLKNVDYRAIGVKLLVLYSNISSRIYKVCNKLYKTQPLVKEYVDKAIYYKNSAIAFIENYKIEPSSKNWICTAALLQNGAGLYVDDPYQFNDHYDIITDDETESSILNEFNDLLVVTGNCLTTDTHIKSFLLSIKYNSAYVYRIVNSSRTDYDVVIPPIKSSVKFISIEYTHPNMKSSLFIDLDKNYYMVGNELLSPIFVKRYLCYQSLKYWFDGGYVLNIIDGELNSVSIKSNQHVVLNNDTYEIVNY
jgi:hypothetical protein